MRSTGKCDIMYSLKEGKSCMKTKIIYISGNEIFDMSDIRAAFEEVRNALNLDKDTVLFGVPVDAEDAGFATQKTNTESIINEPEPVEIDEEPVVTTEIIETVSEITPAPIAEEEIESVAEKTVKKRGRPRKEMIVETVEETIKEPFEQEATKEDVVVPILSVLSTKEAENQTDNTKDDLEIIPEFSEDSFEESKEIKDEEIINPENNDDDEADLEKLLSAMRPLEEDILEEQSYENSIQEQDSSDISVDATLEQLATEFAENQDKIAAETKSSSRSKIGKLRNILPFKQSKHKDTGLGDLFGWAGIAANDEEFSVPGFFTSTAAKK